MKKFLRFITLLLIMSLSVSFFACHPPVEEGEKSITVIVLKSDNTADTYSENTDSLYLGEVLDEMVSESDIEMTAEDNGFGRLITKIGPLEDDPDDFSSWIGIYTDEEDVTLIFSEYSISYGGKEYHATALGIDEMPVHDGMTYIFNISASN